MIEKIITKIEKFSSRNSLRFDPEKGKISDLIKGILDGKYGEAIKEENIRGDFSFIKNKEIEIKESIEKIKNKFLKRGIKSINDKDKEFLKYCFDSKILDENFRTDLLRLKIKNILKKIQTPLCIRNFDGNSEKIQNFHDIDHNLFDKEKQLLIYFIENELLSDKELDIVKNILKKGGDSLEYFINQKDENFIENYFKEMKEKNL